MSGLRRGAVVVTGSSTGIGRACALGLDRAGFAVYAGVRKAEDGDALRAAAPRLEPLIVDVTDGEAIAAAAERVREATGGRLAGLVNNAGVAVAAPGRGRRARRAAPPARGQRRRPGRGDPGLPGDDPRRARADRLHVIGRRSQRAPLPLPLQRLQARDRGDRGLAATGDAAVRGRGLDHRARVGRDPDLGQEHRRRARRPPGASTRRSTPPTPSASIASRRSRPRPGRPGSRPRRWRRRSSTR